MVSVNTGGKKGAGKRVTPTVGIFAAAAKEGAIRRGGPIEIVQEDKI